MERKIIIDKDELIQKYVNEKLSQKACAKYFGCSPDTIVANLKDYDIPSHKPGSWSKSKTIMNLNDEMLQIIDGSMLGDGCLYLHKHCTNALFAYASKSYQHVEYVTKPFMEYSYNEGIKEVVVHDLRTNKDYKRYTFRTVVSETLTDQYNRWYKNGVKHIPDDLVLTPLTCLIWYIGDGCLSGSNKTTSQEIKFATDCFEKDELEKIILPQLQKFNPILSRNGTSKTGKENYQIRIKPKEKVIEFLNYIGECPFEEYQYKWEIKERKIPSYEDFYEDWKKLYLNGTKYVEIARMYNCDPSTVWKFLDNNNLRKPFIGYKEYYKEWEKRYFSGESFTQIANDYGCYPQTVSYHIKQLIKKGVIHDDKT